MFSSRYQRKRTNEVDKRGCFVCYKPTNVVLLNENPTADFFYVCESHLADKGFAKPDTPPEQQIKLEKEIKDLKKDWDAKKPPLPPKPDDLMPETSGSGADTKKPIEADTNKVSGTEGQVTSPATKWFTIDAQIHKLRIQHKVRLANQRRSAQLLKAPLPQAPTHLPE